MAKGNPLYRKAHEDLVTRSIRGLMLPRHATVRPLTVQLLGLGGVFGDGVIDFYATGGFGPDLGLAKQDEAQIRTILEVKAGAPSNATAMETCRAAGAADGELAAAVQRHYANRPLKEQWIAETQAGGEGVWQIDAYVGWKWWSGLPDQVSFDPDTAELIYLTTDYVAPSTRFHGSASSNRWRHLWLPGVIRDVNVLRAELAGELTQDEHDAIAVATYQVYTRCGQAYDGAREWVKSLQHAEQASALAVSGTIAR